MISRRKQYIFLALALLLVAATAYVLGIELDDTLIISQSELINESASKQKPLLLDVRNLWEYEIDHVPNAMNIPYSSLGGNELLKGAGKDALIVVYCETGVRSRIAQVMLKHAGYKNIKRLDGDIRAWRTAGLPLVRKNLPIIKNKGKK